MKYLLQMGQQKIHRKEYILTSSGLERSEPTLKWQQNPEIEPPSGVISISQQCADSLFMHTFSIFVDLITHT